ncbi:MAG: NAD(P)/FAD-dependent oxidoreductase [Bacilli bacterium]
MKKQRQTQVVIIGSGPAGITAAIYLKRAQIDLILLDLGAPGGKINQTAEIENYPGIKRIFGPDLAYQLFEQLQFNNIEVEYGQASRITFLNPGFEVETDEEIIRADFVIVATGTVERRLQIPGEERYISRGVSFCAVCDGVLYKEKKVVVVGGGNSAFQEALFLASLAAKVYLVHRRQGFRADEYLVQKARETKKIEFVLEVIPLEIIGEEVVTGIVLENTKTKEKTILKTDAVFPFIGLDPSSDFLADLGVLTPRGFIEVQANMETKVPGLYGAGDIVDKGLRQIVTATNDGAIAAMDIAHKLRA